MHVEIAQLAGRDGDKEYNLAAALAAIEHCGAGAQVLVLPELQVSGFPSRQNVAALAEPIGGPSVAALHAAARRRGVSVVAGFAEADGGEHYNTTVLIAPDQGVVLRYRKTHLFRGERGVFRPGDRFATTRWRGVRVGLLVCYDIEFPETARALAQLGADVLFVTNGNMDPYGPVHRACIQARALENQLFAVMANRVGPGDNDFVFAGGSAAVDPFGSFLAEAGREPTTMRTHLDLSQLAAARRHYVYSEDQRVRIPGEFRVQGDLRELLIP